MAVAFPVRLALGSNAKSHRNRELVFELAELAAA
jgi:hypothetical protein